MIDQNTQTLLTTLPRLDVLASPPVNWIWPGLFAEQAFHIISGEPGAMKSMLAFYVSLGVARGEVFGLTRPPQPVLYIDRENPAVIVKQRFDQFKQPANNIWYWGMWHENMPPFAVDEQYVQLVQYFVDVMKTPPFVVFDSLMRFHAKDENDAGEMSVVTSSFRRLCALGATVVVLHHKGKAKDQGVTAPYRGTSEIAGACDIGFSMAKSKDNLGQCLDLVQFKNRFDEESSLKFHYVNDIEGAKIIPVVGLTTKEDNDLRYTIMSYPGLGPVELAARLALGQNKVREMLTKGEGLYWELRMGDKGKHLYFPIYPK